MPHPLVPLHIGTVNGQAVRFFASPLADGGPDFPWACLDDLMEVYGLPDAARTAMLGRLHALSASAMTVTTEEGPVVILPHPDAQGMVHAMTKLRGMNAEEDYALAGAAALKGQVADLTDKQLMAYSQAAISRWKT